MAAGKLVGAPLVQSFEPNQAKQLADPLANLGAIKPPVPWHDIEPESDVLGDGHVREQRVMLEHETDTPLARRHLAHVVAVKQDAPAARVCHLQPGNNTQQGGLARTRRA